MEGSRFGFDLPPAYKFDPTDADIVAHYLLPRAIGFPNPYAHAIIDDDPCSCPPWELMRRHGHHGSDHAFFFGPPREPDPRKKAARAVAPGEDDGVGGTWDGQKSVAIRLVLLRAGGGGPRLEVTYKRHNLSYYHGPQKRKTSGWVMHDYQIIDPPHLAGTVLSRVKITGREKKKEGKQQKQAGDDVAIDAGKQVVVPPGPDQPGPSNYFQQPAVGGGEEYGAGAMGDNTGVCYVGDGNDYYMYGGDGSGGGGGGDCFPAGDGGSYAYADGDVMGGTGGYYADNGNNYLNQDSGYYGYPDGGGGGGDYVFHVGDNNSYEYPDGGKGGREEDEQ